MRGAAGWVEARPHRLSCVCPSIPIPIPAPDLHPCLASHPTTQPTHQMRHLATYLLLKLGGNESPSAADVTAALGAVGVEADGDRLKTLLAELEGKDVDELIKEGSELLAQFGGGGGGGAAAAAAPAAAAADAGAGEKKKKVRSG